MVSRNIPDGRVISDSQRFQDINADQDCTPAARATCQEYRIISKLRPGGLCLTSVSATMRIAAILPHLRMLRYVQMPTPFRASKLLPVALHFACKVRYVRSVPSSVVRNKFGVRSVRLLFGSILSRLQTAENWLKSAS